MTVQKYHLNTMQTAIIQGSQIPQGRVRVSGAKNAATRLMAAALLTREKVTLTNFPTELVDVRHKGRFMKAVGVNVQYSNEDSCVTIQAEKICPNPLADYDYPIRTTYLLAAGLLARNGVARIPYPGGCKLGERKYDLHLLVWEHLGCKVVERSDHIEIIAGAEGLMGAEIDFPITTVGGTENALLCGAIAKGITVVNNAYITPEIVNLIELLRLMGAEIEVQGGSLITIRGKGSLLRGASIRVIADRIEALTWIVYAAISKGSVVVEDVPFDLMEIPLLHLREAGINYFRNQNSVYISPECIGPAGLQPFELACGTHPGIISDMQPFYVLLALAASGKSLIVDYRYPKRVAFLAELEKFAPGSVQWSAADAAIIRVEGGKPRKGATVRSTDLRGSMALVMAGLIAEGTTEVSEVGMALRGYNELAKKLASLGIKLTVRQS